MKTMQSGVPESLRFMMEIPSWRNYLEQSFPYRSDKEFINGITGEDIVWRLELEKSPRLLDLISKNFFIKMLLESPNLENLLLGIAKEFRVVNLFIKTWNKCNHECSNYCLLKWNPNWESIKFEDYADFLNKYSSWLHNVNSLHFVWQELFLMEKFEDYLEEALKKWISYFSIVTRWAWSKKDNDDALAKLSGLKQRHPNFKMFLTTSLDRYSTLNAKDHDSMLRNIYNIIRAHLYLFWENIAHIQSTGSITRENWIPEIRYDDMEFITKDMNVILSYFEKDWLKHIGTELKPGLIILTLSDWKTIELSLSRRKNTYDEPEIRDVAVSQDESGGTICEMINNPFHVFLDKDFNLLTCTWFHSMFYHKTAKFTNAISNPNADVLKVLMDSRKRAFWIFSYTELAEYFCNPKDIYICDKI